MTSKHVYYNVKSGDNKLELTHPNKAFATKLANAYARQHQVVVTVTSEIAIIPRD